MRPWEVIGMLPRVSWKCKGNSLLPLLHSVVIIYSRFAGLFVNVSLLLWNTDVSCNSGIFILFQLTFHIWKQHENSYRDHVTWFSFRIIICVICCIQNSEWNLMFVWLNYTHDEVASQVKLVVKNLPAVQETQVQSMGQEDLEEGMATHSSILAWRIP